MSHILAIDMAVVGRPNTSPHRRRTQAPKDIDATRNGAVPVRLAYAAITARGASEPGVLALKPNSTWPSGDQSNLTYGGVSTDTLAMCGQQPSELLRHKVWQLYETADLIVCHWADFHIPAFHAFAKICGVEWDARRQPDVFDTCAKSTLICRIPSQDPNVFKPPGLHEAADLLLNINLLDGRQRALVGTQPVIAFAALQVATVAKVYQELMRRQDRAAKAPPPEPVEDIFAI